VIKTIAHFLSSEDNSLNRKITDSITDVIQGWVSIF